MTNGYHKRPAEKQGKALATGEKAGRREVGEQSKSSESKPGHSNRSKSTDA